jgi:general secretion pathway protein K
VLALSVVEATRRHGQLARNSFDVVQDQELADSAIRLAILELSSPASQAASRGVTGRAFDIFNRSIAVGLDYESGRVDLNAAPLDLLTAVFAGNQFSEVAARELADRITDWRDADDERAAHGAERSEYLQAGRTSGPRNGSFESVPELAQVLGLERLNDELLDAFTVYSHSTSVREDTAPPVVMRALSWADAQQFGGHRWLTGEPRAAQFEQARSLAGEAVRLRACVPSIAALCRVAIVRFTGSTQRPVQVFAWYTNYR